MLYQIDSTRPRRLYLIGVSVLVHEQCADDFHNVQQHRVFLRSTQVSPVVDRVCRRGDDIERERLVPDVRGGAGAGRVATTHTG
jgi:hypothetical protein